jgi:hypothetical protein
MKLSIILRMFRMKNITAAKLMNPRNRWVGDSPLNIEICLTLLGINDKQLLCFIFSSIASLISVIAIFEPLIVTNGICYRYPLLLVGGI